MKTCCHVNAFRLHILPSRAFVLLLALALPFFSCGCMMLTKRTQEIGLRTELLGEPTVVWLGTNGSLALEVKATYVVGHRGREGVAKKYLLGSPEAVQASIAAAKRRYPGSIYLNTNLHPPAIVLPLDSFPLAVTNKMARWELLPKDFGGPDADENALPLIFQQNSKRLSGEFKWRDCVPYSYQDVPYCLHFYLQAHPRERRKWWGYPLQILLPATVALDIVTAPIQCGIALHEFGRAFH